jgi:hypothetical protein
MWSRRESNSYLEFRKLLFYPLNYGTVAGANIVNVGMCVYADMQIIELPQSAHLYIRTFAH